MSVKRKESRWDRIRKRHMTTNGGMSLKTEAVKRLIETDFISQHNRNVMNGTESNNLQLDPVLVMDIRHQMFKTLPRKLPIAAIAHQKSLETCKAHNVAVEDHYLENQLERFREQLAKQYKRIKIPEKKLHNLLIDNTVIMEGLEVNKKCFEDFYKTPVAALNEVNQLITKHKVQIEEWHYTDNMSEENCIASNIEEEYKTWELNQNILKQDNIYNECEESVLNTQTDAQSTLKNENLLGNGNGIIYIENSSSSDANKDVKLCERKSPNIIDTEDHKQSIGEPRSDSKETGNCVHFNNETPPVHYFKRQCSSSSEGLDSVVSEIAEEALMELQIEEQQKQQQQQQLANTPRNDIEKSKCDITLIDSSFKNQLLTEDLLITGLKAANKTESNVKSTESNNSSLISDHVDDEHEKTKVIERLLQKRSQTMRKYFLKWIHFTTIEKLEREHVHGRADRVKKINAFLDKVRFEKRRLKATNVDEIVTNENVAGGESHQQLVTYNKDPLNNIKITKKYQNKIKVQQDIIDLQRIKLERQERIIMELKLSRIAEEAKEARHELKQELKSVIRSGDPKLKAKAKCLQLIGNFKDEDDERFERLQGHALIMPKFLRDMQERALERSIKHEQAKQRRLHLEAEKEAQKLAAEEAKRLQDEEAKRMRMEALKEKRRQEKLEKVAKERERQRAMDNMRKAQEFSRRRLLKRIGLEGFKRLLQRKRDYLRKCHELRVSLYKKTYFHIWLSAYRVAKSRRNQKADQLYECILKRRMLHVWLYYVELERSKMCIAIDWHDLKLTDAIFGKWWRFSEHMRMIEETKMRQAASHHEWHLKWKVLDCWQRLPQILKLEKETEERRQRWRMKIWELLPDYTPNREELNYI